MGNLNMTIGIFQDLHANLPALRKALDIFREHQCSGIYHVGDLIGIGPYPREVMELASSIPKMAFIMGNHDYWYAYGLPHPVPSYMSKEEVAHHSWTHQQLGETYRSSVQQWSWVKNLSFSNGNKIVFQHYGLNEEKNWFQALIKKPGTRDLDRMFGKTQADIIFYGHDHNASDLIGNSRYTNLGSAGCFDKAEVRIGILKVTNDHLDLEKYSIPYEDGELIRAFEERQVPARAFIKRTFLKRGSRF
jgi:predicted phosphodiesterase